jgi:hypothetical protein
MMMSANTEVTPRLELDKVRTAVGIVVKSSSLKLYPGSRLFRRISEKVDIFLDLLKAFALKDRSMF